MGADLYKADLGRANLEGANLEGANLGRAKLAGANLMVANLMGIRGLEQASSLHEVRSWEGAKIERKWVERLGLDAEELGLKVLDNVEDE